MPGVFDSSLYKFRFLECVYLRIEDNFLVSRLPVKHFQQNI